MHTAYSRASFHVVAGFGFTCTSILNRFREIVLVSVMILDLTKEVYVKLDVMFGFCPVNESAKQGHSVKEAGEVIS